ncbi:DNA recombination protein RmuC [Candidatus Kuenenbacteria bacterium CG11_big_fil_rev_8_21_14_0_20_37_9]|uniref:DNA recombination protein RmuC n=1 Tax=Candidatus Kuenenbacteria bacterium CG08_land_8_20_14_0_20_37_23 TaxID=1974617 RepID=A0A2M6XT69_9BACT|nr:MAG: DNA recombination protein RmuC [Candidatus Kuenenbacteria bacterium CG11_big_fil_rev_8_21_14_0_20_37_9]PIU10836.1 MAG: DNA recombination protein RmuC [Candidatus Kuenenbacteria bacterium CG08_land_8_20_14_0_20_37_23]
MTTTILLIINTLGIVFLVFLLFKNKQSDNTDQITKAVEVLFDRTNKILKEEMFLSRKEAADSEKRLREELSSLFKGFGDSIDKRMSEFASAQNKNFEGFSIKLTELIDKNDAKMEKVREAVEKKLESLQKDNSEKLEAMRVTVDEKLHATLEKRFGESFKVVSDRLEAVHKGLGEMQTLALGVGDLKKMLSNVKSRGTWGEAQLGNLIEEILTPEQYEKNVKTKKASRDNVEFAVKLPGNDDDVKQVWLPIDAKFPLEDYQRLVEAQGQGNLLLTEELSKSLEMRVKSEAKDIRDKYLDPPYTTDFGILFVPIESLYAEILRKPGLFELIRREYRVIIAGPTTTQVILNSLQMGFRTLTIQKRSSEVWTLLGAVKTEFGKFGDLLEKTHKKIQEASNTIEGAVTKTRTIERKLNKVQNLPVAEAEKLVLEAPDEEGSSS